jgi:trehalose/maltose hydrolase-like predicted phosphorylase
LRSSDVAARLVNSLDTTSDLIEEFEDFFTLEPLDLAAYTPRTIPMDVLLEHERIQRSQMIKHPARSCLSALEWWFSGRSGVKVRIN